MSLLHRMLRKNLQGMPDMGDQLFALANPLLHRPQGFMIAGVDGSAHRAGAYMPSARIQRLKPRWQLSWTQRACWQRPTGQNRAAWSMLTWRDSPTSSASLR